MVDGVDCQASCKNRTYNKYRWNRFKKRYELNNLLGAAGPEGTCQATRIKIRADHSCGTFEHWDALMKKQDGKPH